MVEKIITNEQIDEIGTLLSRRKTIEVRKILKELPENEFKIKIERLVRNSGRTNMISLSEIKQIIKEEEKN